MTIQDTFNLAIEHHRAGRLGEAEMIYRQILRDEPGHAEVPVNLGSLLHDLGRHHEAVAVYRTALARDPGNARIWSNLGNTLCELGEIEPSIAACRQALSLNPRHFGAYNNLGNALKRKGLLDESAQSYRQAIAQRPDFAFAHNNLGSVLIMLGDLDAAIACFRLALEHAPRYAEALNNLGSALGFKGAWDQAIAHCRRSVAMQPNDPSLHWNLALMLLRRGDLEEGWTEYEWRWGVRDLIASPMKYSPARLWDGGDLNGRRILLHAEQGLGDAIQFARYIPLVAERGGHVVLYLPEDLVPLLRHVKGVAETAAWNEPLPEFDVHAPLLSLPRIFKTTLASIPATVPYLSADLRRSEQWRQRLSSEKRRKVGLVWAGRSSHVNDRQRSLTLAALAPLARASGVCFFSLQKGPAAEQVGSAPMELTDWTADLNDFADTAALIDNLDLIISVDTAVAHLAGALAKPAWTLLPFAPDWRWMLDRSDSPWYPTMRLLRQRRIGDWRTPVEQAVEALRLL